MELARIPCRRFSLPCPFARPPANPCRCVSCRFLLHDTLCTYKDAGNSCKHQGYAEFDQQSWPSDCAPTKADWIKESVGQCGDGDAYPEEFWNCADISITSGEQRHTYIAVQGSQQCL